MKQKKVNRVALLLHWAGEQKAWLFLAVFLSAAGGLCIVVPYMGIYQLMDAVFSGTCTTELVVRIVAMIAVAVTLRFVLFGCSGVAAHKGAYPEDKTNMSEYDYLTAGGEPEMRRG